MWAQAFQILVLVSSLLLLMALVIRGRSIFVVAPCCALLAVVLSGGEPLTAMTGAYMNGFADYVRRFYLIFALGAAFGKMMDDSGAAIRIARSVGDWIGTQRACLAVVLACAVLTYGGVSLFVVGFSVYPLAVQLFRSANLSRRFIPGAIAFGSVTFTMTSAGSPEIQNLIPIQYLVDASTKMPLTDARAGWPASIIVATVMFLLGQFYLEWAIRRDSNRGIGFEDSGRDARRDAIPDGDLPTFGRALIPLGVTLVALNLLPFVCRQLARWLPSSADTSSVTSSIFQFLQAFPEDANLAIFLGVVAALIVLRRRLADPWSSLGDGFINGFMAVGSTSAVVGFGATVKELPAFTVIVQWVTQLPVDPLIGAAIALAIISAIAGSASGGQGIALPIIKPIYVDVLAVPPRALHRVVSIASGTLDSLPANGYLVMLIRNICGETHARSYGPVFVTTVLVPIVGVALAIGLFKLFPGWTQM